MSLMTSFLYCGSIPITSPLEGRPTPAFGADMPCFTFVSRGALFVFLVTTLSHRPSSLDAKTQFVASTTLSQNHCVILPDPFQGAYKVRKKRMLKLLYTI